MTDITHERLREVLMYNPRTGAWTWLKRTGRGFNRSVGSEAGSLDKHSGYKIISVDRLQYRASRLAHFYVHGTWPTHFMDHKNGDRKSDSFSNIRPAQPSQNSTNRPTRNKSGFKGVQEQTKGRWTASIGSWRKKTRRCLGTFDNIEDAARAYDRAAIVAYGEFGRLNFPRKI